MKKVLSSIKPYLRWVILGVTLFFLVKTLKDNWEQVLEIRISDSGWVSLGVALIVTIMAHVWSAVVWFGIIKEFHQKVNLRWAIRVYLLTNIAKYLPGNIWHFYGRINATKQAGIPVETAILSVLIEPLLMAASALGVALIGSTQESWFIQFLCFLAVVSILHPRVLNPVIKYLAKIKLKGKKSADIQPVTELKLERYLVKPFLGEICFVLIRGFGFLLTILAFNSVELNQIFLIFSAFSLAWLLGLVVPGAPGGVGVFEVTALTLLEHKFSPGILLSAIAFYRLISVLAETFAAGLAWLEQKSQN
ncbi:lysylphosphatidylglycerol synthase domain-containing protein [Okeania sp.]|uniref:lysylphosphatidylglycerol synthase transmembrane domain-containing protein n=1 Tax=Okeania sp. TaxID=3100323 RepID=UPI002B4B216E|nr:lysylphosphatidylglycerol synthase domain-containing protein [Okeania sp.]MEB3342008.1 lysylphosphatidylglycerol synthase domain-containing protein [Okeania sp.]